MITVAHMMSGAEGAPVMMVMIGIATMPVPIMCPTTMCVPPTGIIAPIPRRAPCVPITSPEPIIDNRSVNIHRFDDVVGTIYILVTYHLNGNLVGRFIFLHVDRSYILVDVFRQDSLQNDQTFVSCTGLYNSEVVYFAVTVEV
jgi:hypothetical protein